MAPILRSHRQKEVTIPPPALRRSPRLTLRAAVKEPHSNLTSKQAIRRTNPRSRPYCSRSRKRGISTDIDSLPDELLLDILLRVPAEDIQEKARFVCWKWKRIVHGYDFAQAHLHRTGYGLLISMKRKDPPILMAATQGVGIEVSKLITKSKSRGDVKASCNGLILVNYMFQAYVLHVVNPATKVSFKLPRFCCKGSIGRFGIAYASASMEYKVVATYRPSPMSLLNPRLVQCNVITVGVDSTWRNVAAQHLSPEANKLLDSDPLITEGSMHWASPFGKLVLTLNVEMEVFAESRAPRLREYKIRGRKYHFLSTGRHLSVLISFGDLLWQVWEMKGGSGEWTKVLPDINLNARKSEIQQLTAEDDVLLRPVGWVKYPKVLLFFPGNTINYDRNTTSSSCIVYHGDRDEIKSIKLPAPVDCCEAPLVHKNSLVCLS